MKSMSFEKFTYLSAACVLLVAGCSQEADELPASSNTASEAALDITALSPAKPTPPAPYGGMVTPAGTESGPTTIAATEVSADTAEALTQLNNILTGTFLAEIGRPPKSVNEFVERGLIRQLPKAPEGQKFFYDAQQNKIVLAVRQPGEVDPAPMTAQQSQQAYLQTAAEINKRISQ
jgi:hypothetical protein